MTHVTYCHDCYRARGSGIKPALGGDGIARCRTCRDDHRAGRPAGSTVARLSFAVRQNTCPHCGAAKGVLCSGPGVVRHIHARRRGVAAELQKSLREDVSFGN